MADNGNQQIPNEYAGGMSVLALIIVFVAYAFTRSIKPSSSYLTHYFGYVDKASKDQSNYQELSPIVSI